MEFSPFSNSNQLLLTIPAEITKKKSNQVSIMLLYTAKDEGNEIKGNEQRERARGEKQKQNSEPAVDHCFRLSLNTTGQTKNRSEIYRSSASAAIFHHFMLKPYLDTVFDRL